jgi:hypothetical protein
MTNDNVMSLKIETIGVLIAGYYTDAEIVTVLSVDIDTVKSIRAKSYNYLRAYA